MVGAERILSGSRPRLVDNTEALHSKPVDADGVFIMPGLSKEHHIEASRALKIYDGINLIPQGANIEQTK